MAEGPALMTYDEKLEHVLRRATAVFAEKGYHRASVRDIARATGMSLAGLYYYFTSKQQLLFLIADHSHSGMLERGLAGLAGATDPRDKLGRLIRAHLEYALEDMDRIKVLSHEIGSLHGEYLAKVVEKRKRYFAALVGILRDKAWEEMLRALAGAVDRMWITAPPSAPAERRWDLDEVKRGMEGDGEGVVQPDFDRALQECQAGAGTILVTGSFHTVGDALARLPGFAPLG